MCFAMLCRVCLAKLLAVEVSQRVLFEMLVAQYYDAFVVFVEVTGFVPIFFGFLPTNDTDVLHGFVLSVSRDPAEFAEKYVKQEEVSV